MNEEVEEFEAYLHQTEKKLNGVNPSKVNMAEADVFHLMSNHIEKEELPPTIPNDGSNELCALISYIKIFEEMVKLSTPRNPIYQQLLDALYQSREFTMKSTFLPPELFQGDEAEKEKKYYKELGNLNSSDTSYQEKFLEDYSLGSIQNIPKQVLINNLTWDALEKINKLGSGELTVLALGTIDHSIALEIKCLEAPNRRSPGIYQCSIYNTGSGASNHCITKDEHSIFAKPLTINNLNREAFTYSYMSELITCLLDSKDVDRFYRIHDEHLVNIAKGEVTHDNGKWYPLQKFGTCSYNSIEAWLQNYLDLEDIQKMNTIKFSLAISKQQKIIACRKQLPQDPIEKLKSSICILESSKKQLTLLLNKINNCSKKKKNALKKMELIKLQSIVG